MKRVGPVGWNTEQLMLQAVKPTKDGVPEKVTGGLIWSSGFQLEGSRGKERRCWNVTEKGVTPLVQETGTFSSMEELAGQNWRTRHWPITLPRGGQARGQLQARETAIPGTRRTIGMKSPMNKSIEGTLSTTPHRRASESPAPEKVNG